MKPKKRKAETRNNNKKSLAHPRESAENFQNGKICQTSESLVTEQRNIILTKTDHRSDGIKILKDNNCNNLTSDTPTSIKIKNIDISMSSISLNDTQKTNKKRFNSHNIRSKSRKSKMHITIAESFAKERTETYQKYEIKINYEKTEFSEISNSCGSDEVVRCTKLIEPLPETKIKPPKKRSSQKLSRKKKVCNTKNPSITTSSQKTRLEINKFISSNESSQIVSCNKSNEITDEQDLFGNLSCDNGDEEYGVLSLPDLTLKDSDVCENVTTEKFCNKGISDEELKKRLKDRLRKQKGQNLMKFTTPDFSEESSSDSGNSNSQENLAQVTFSPKSTSLQDVLNEFMNDPQLKNVDINILKRDICMSWVSNNFSCKKLSCQHYHNAYELFKKKLKCYSCKIIISFTVLMQTDILFVDLIMAVFKVLSERENPEIWISFLIFFVFCVTEPSDIRFIKFWANSARFFCQLSSDYSAASGFASLLSIFYDIDEFQKKKIVEFINVIKQPPTQICITCDLLEPVLKMDLPLQLLTEALKSCVDKQIYSEVLKVHETLIPKIMEATLTLKQFELLIKFCQVLKSMSENDRANNLKQRINDKIDGIKSKPSQNGYFNTAQLKKKLADSLAKANVVVSEDCFENYFQEKICRNYFKLDENYHAALAKAMHSNSLLSDPRKRSVFAEMENFEGDEREENDNEEINNIRLYLNIRQFDLLAKYLNELKGDITKATEEILRELFQKKISVEEIVEFVNILLLSCGSESAALVIASVGITFIFHLVKVGEWDKAYTVLSLCNAKQVNLINGSVFSLNGSMEISQCRTALLLAEVYTYKEKYKNALHILKIYFLFSPNRSLYKLSWKEDDEKIRIRILEELLDKLTRYQLTDMAYDLFYLIWKGQNGLESPLDIRRFANEVLTLLLNEDNNEAIRIYNEITSEMELKSCTIRAVLVTLVRHNELEKAKSIPLSLNQSVYFLADVTSCAAIMVVSSFWLEEEIFIMFDTLFDLLIERKYNADEFFFGNFDDYGVRIQISYSEDSSFSTVTPLCLSLVRSSFPNIYERIQRVLQNKFMPPVQLNILSKSLILEKYSLKRHLDYRVMMTSNR